MNTGTSESEISEECPPASVLRPCSLLLQKERPTLTFRAEGDGYYLLCTYYYPELEEREWEDGHQ